MPIVTQRAYDVRANKAGKNRASPPRETHWPLTWILQIILHIWEKTIEVSKAGGALGLCQKRASE
eukprot:10517087-Heterocapsa_arctica.AAC.1